MASDVTDPWLLLDAAQDARVVGDDAQAHLLLDGAARAFKAVGNVRGGGHVVHQRATLHLAAGWLDDAETALDEADRVFSEADDAVGRGHVAHSRGDLARRKGDHEAALRAYVAAFEAYGENDNPAGMGNAARSIGEMLVQKGDIQQAKAFAEEAISCYLRADHVFGIAAAYTLRATVAHRLKDPAAGDFLERALVKTREVGDKNGSAGLLMLLAKVARDNGDSAAARCHYEDAADGFRQLGDSFQVTAVMLAAADLELEAGDLAAAMSRLNDADGVAIPGGASSLLWRIATTRAAVHDAAGEVSDAIASYQEAVRRSVHDPDPSAEPRALANLGSAEEAAKRPFDGAQSMVRSARASLRAGHHQFAALSFGHAGAILRKANRHDAAIAPLSSAAALFAALDEQEETAETLYELAMIAMDATRWKECLDLLVEARMWANRAGNQQIVGMTHINESDVYKFTGDIPAAMKAARQAEACFLSVGNRVSSATAIRALAELHVVLGDYEQAEKLCREALATYLELEEFGGAGNARATLAEVAGMRGDSGAAIEHLDAAREYYLQSDELQGLASVTHTLASHVHHRPEDDHFFDDFESQAYRLFQKIGDLIGQANVQRSIGERYLARDRKRSKKALVTARDLFSDMNHELGTANACRLLARIAILDNDLGDAEALLLRAERAAAAVHSEITKGLVLIDMAMIPQAKEDIEGAITIYYRALEIFDTIGALGGLEYTGLILPGLLRRRGRHQEAIAVLRRVLKAVRSSTRWVDSNFSRGQHQSKIFQLRDFALELADEASSPDVAGEFIELGAAALVPGLRQLLSAGGEVGEGMRSLGAITARLAALEVETPPDQDPALQQIFHAERAARRRGLIAALTQVIGHDLRRIIDPEPPAYASVIRHLDRQGVAVLQVAYTLGPRSERKVDLVWTIPGHDRVHLRVELGSASIDALNRVLALHGDNAVDDDLVEFYRMVDAGTEDQAFRELSSQLLPREFMEELLAADVDRLLIVPDPLLWNIPWTALVTGPAYRLVDIAGVSLSPALALLDLGEADPSAGRPVHAWLADVQDIDTEIESLQYAFGNDLVLASSGSALVSGLHKDGQQVGTVVISVHGQAENGLGHGVVLAPGVELTAAHLLGWRMPGTLVIGACWTARLNPDPAGDQIALATLAVAKGANNFVGAIYPLPDEIPGQVTGSPTAKLLATLYSGLSTGSVSSALWETQKSYRHLPAHCWAGLVHVSGSVYA